MTDTWIGDDFFHQGAFRQSFGVEYAPAMEFTKDGTRSVQIDMRDHYDWYLQFPTLSSIAKATGITDVPSWVGFRTHPAWDDYWQGKAMELVLTRPVVPLLFVGGFWDQEDIYGPQGAYKAVIAHDSVGTSSRRRAGSTPTSPIRRTPFRICRAQSTAHGGTAGSSRTSDLSTIGQMS